MAPVKPSKRTTPKGDIQKATSASEWKSSARHPVYLELPSGNTCLAINKGLKVFMQEGTIPNSLLPIVDAAISQAQGLAPKQMKDMASDLKMLGQVMQLCDAIVVSCVKSPNIQPSPTAQVYGDEEEIVTVVVEAGETVHDVVTDKDVVRDPEVLYVDECELDDKMFVMQWAMGGVKEVETFRKEYEAAMADVSGGSKVDETAK